MARFYVEGDEIDVQDPTFFFESEEYIELKDTIEETLNTYA